METKVIDKKLQIMGNLKKITKKKNLGDESFCLCPSLAGVTFAWLPMMRAIRYEYCHANTSITCYVWINGLKIYMGNYFSYLPFSDLCVCVRLDSYRICAWALQCLSTLQRRCL